MVEFVGLFIDGTWAESDSGAVGQVINPATAEHVADVAHAGIADLERAVAAAARGFDLWRKTPAVERSATIRRAAALLRERQDEISRKLTAEQGKPLAEAWTEVTVSADLLDWFADDGRRVYGKILPPRVAGGEQRVMKEPVGPVAAFTPWNFPLSQAVRKLGPALAAGCSVVVKPPENTPCSVAGLIRCFADAGLPAGVVNVVFGIPAQISEFLIPHPVIRKVSFTGSVPVGKHLAAMAGQYMKPATMELGGHSPTIIFGDADLDKTMQILAASKFRNAGQVCVSPTRFLVQQNVYSDFVSEFTKRAEAVRVGNGADEGTMMGPLVSAARQKAVSDLVSDAVAQGAALRTGGERIGNVGSFYAPTVLADVTPAMRIMNEEPFGPVALFAPFADEAAVLREANRLPYGLAAYVFTENAGHMDRVAAGLETGMVTINHIGLAVPEAHFGGVRDSGYGSEGGSEAIEAYLKPKFVTRTAYV
jgi:succinate-semialdehyde dehydrogenase/glutarate-semialdehyde dehydrogenase